MTCKYRDCSSLASVTIGNNVAEIGNWAFYGTPWYNNFRGLLYVGRIAYKYQGAMPTNTEIEIREGTTEIYRDAFSGCTGLTSVTIPESVTSIGDDAFSGCGSLTKAEFASIESLCRIKFNQWNANPLYYAHHLYIGGREITDLVIPGSVTNISNYAFYNCSYLTSVTIPNSVTNIDTGAFGACRGLTSITIPNNVTSISSWVFSGCNGLTSIEIPNGVTSIGNYAFQNCSGLTSVTIPNSVTSIGLCTFEYCSGLTSVTIPSSVTEIGISAFRDCSALISVFAGNPNPISIDGTTFSNRTNATLYVLKGSKVAYEAANYWKEFKQIIELEWGGLAGDVDGDGKLTIADVTKLVNIILGKE